MNILFLGGFYSPKKMETIIAESKGKTMFASHNYELAFMSGLVQHQNIDLRCVVALGVGSYPHNNTKIYTYPESYDYKGVDVKSIGFCNFIIVNKIHLVFNTCRELRKQIKSFDGKNVNIIISTATIYLLVSVSLAKLFSSKKILTSVIVNDIPLIMDEMNGNPSFKTKVRIIIDKWGMHLLRKCNSYIVMTLPTINYFRVNKPHIVLEGIIDVNKDSLPDIEENQPQNHIILYAGSINKIFGIMDLVKAFEKIDIPNSELWICGSGDAQEDISIQTSINPKIKYFGLVSLEESKEMQKRCTLLVNPRTSKGEYTKYSFPSKTIEYLLSGKPTIMHNLPCLPNEYRDYLYIPKEETVDALASEIQRVISQDYSITKARAKEAQLFILNKKNSKAQTKRVLDLLKQASES